MILGVRGSSFCDIFTRDIRTGCAYKDHWAVVSTSKLSPRIASPTASANFRFVSTSGFLSLLPDQTPLEFIYNMSNVTLPSNGFYRFINKESGTALELRNGAQVEGTDIYGWEKRSIGVDFFNQVWLIEKEPSNDWYKITNPRSGYSWDLDSGKSDNGTRVQVWGYTGGPNQQWLFRGNDGSGYT